ncbi:MAG: DUF433 domain-containing protein [Anaerolineae bacterium]|nr:DUF433 domain-containing protein [Anaerolineae bacterium]
MQQVDFPPINHIEIRNGQARIAGRNVKVKMVISRLIHGEPTTIEDVMEQYNLSRAEVLACLAYYDDYQDQIEQHFRDQDERLHNLAIPLDDLLARLRERQKQQDS